MPKEVCYGETVELRVGVIDSENETLTFTWVISDGGLSGEDSPEVEWTAPALPKPLVSTYTWDGELFVVFHAATATGYIYQKQQ